jgi:sugar lactone lactonase YvrE
MGGFEVALQVPTILGEGPIWSADAQVLYWLDIFRPAINRYRPDDGGHAQFPLSEPIYALGLRAGGGYVAAMESGFAVGAFDGTRPQVWSNPNAGQPVNFNDGKVDPAGRFWSGTMARDWESPSGILYRLAPNGEVRAMQRDLILSNGLGWRGDGRVMYHTDFKHRTVFAYDFDVASGEIANRRPCVVLAEDDGYPDGMTVDAEDCLWVAHWDGWCVTRHAPDGAEIARTPVPVPRPTCPAFGGADLRTLFLTSATMHLSAAQLAEAPLSGALFAMATDVAGRPEPKFAG